MAKMGTQKPKRSSAIGPPEVVMMRRIRDQGYTCINRYGSVGQTRQNALAELEDVAADDAFGLIGPARLECGQNRPVASRLASETSR